MAFFQGVWARKLCKINRVENLSIFDDKKLILLACVTIILCLMGIAVYNFYFIRYLVIVIMAVISFILFRKLRNDRMR